MDENEEPPLSPQMSNQISEGLDFDNDLGGINAAVEESALTFSEFGELSSVDAAMEDGSRDFTEIENLNDIDVLMDEMSSMNSDPDEDVETDNGQTEDNDLWTLAVENNESDDGNESDFEMQIQDEVSSTSQRTEDDGSQSGDHEIGAVDNNVLEFQMNQTNEDEGEISGPHSVENNTNENQTENLKTNKLSTNQKEIQSSATDQTKGNKTEIDSGKERLQEVSKGDNEISEGEIDESEGQEVSDQGQAEVTGQKEESEVEEGEIVSTDDENADKQSQYPNNIDTSANSANDSVLENLKVEDFIDTKKAEATARKIGIKTSLLGEIKKTTRKKSPDKNTTSKSHHRHEKERRKSGNHDKNRHGQDNRNKPSHGHKKGSQHVSKGINDKRDDNRGSRGNSNKKEGSHIQHSKGSDCSHGDKRQMVAESEKEEDLNKATLDIRLIEKKVNKVKNRNPSQNFKSGMGPKEKGMVTKDVTSKTNGSVTGSKDKLKNVGKNHGNQKSSPSQKRNENLKFEEKSTDSDKTLTMSDSSKIETDLDKTETFSDKIEDVLNNLEEMPSSSSENEKSPNVDQTKKDNSTKRKLSNDNSNTHKDQNQPPSKKSKVDSNDQDSNLDETQTFPAQEFQIIDDIDTEEQEQEEDKGGRGIVGNADGDYFSDDLDEDEVYNWLEEGVNKKSISTEKDEEQVHETDKIILNEKGIDPFEVLPEGWIAVTHNSGMFTYLHKATRVCTFSKPYFLGPGSVRKHDIPLSAIPCLQYIKELEKERKALQDKEGKGEGSQSQINGEQPCPMQDKPSDPRLKDDKVNTGDPNDPDKTLTFEDKSEETNSSQTNPGVINPGPPVKIECAETKKIENTLKSEELFDYCKNLFEFRKVTVKKFKTWKERRKHLNEVKKQARPALPASTKLITCQISAEDGTDKPKKKEFVLNPAGKSPVCILHEYAQHTIKIQPRYKFEELENAQNPYCATVLINNIEYGKGYASSKKNAKMNAAKATLDILIPEMSKIEKEAKEDSLNDMSFFDSIKIEDPRISDLCAKTGQPSPYQILLECLKRNYGMGDTHVQTDVKTLKHQKSEYTLTVGKHTVRVVCKNKREGKQRAAQAMLKQLHTHITNLGSLLRLYGSQGKMFKEKKKDEVAVTELQTQQQSNKPNLALLDKLRSEMSKLQAQRKSLTSKGSILIDKVPGGIASLDL